MDITQDGTRGSLPTATGRSHNSSSRGATQFHSVVGDREVAFDEDLIDTLSSNQAANVDAARAPGG